MVIFHSYVKLPEGTRCPEVPWSSRFLADSIPKLMVYGWWFTSFIIFHSSSGALSCCKPELQASDSTSLWLHKVCGSLLLNPSTYTMISNKNDDREHSIIQYIYIQHIYIYRVYFFYIITVYIYIYIYIYITCIYIYTVIMYVLCIYIICTRSVYTRPQLKYLQTNLSVTEFLASSSSSPCSCVGSVNQWTFHKEHDGTNVDSPGLCGFF